MDYFQFLPHARQVVCRFAVILTMAFSMPVFAQETQETVQTAENQKTSEIVASAEAETKTETLTAKVLKKDAFTETVEPENYKIKDFSRPQKSESRQAQSPAGDDTMMGVMGKGTDKIKLGGHVGFVVPVVGRGGGVTTNLGDRFGFGFPVGLTVKTKKNIAVDFEFIPTFNTGRDFVLTIHPGIIYGFKKKYAVGVRAAYDAGAASFGFTPLISRGFKINEKLGFFLEADFPIRSNYRPYGDRFGSIAFAAHAGFAF